MSTTRDRIRQEAAEADRVLEQLRANPELLQDPTPTLDNIAPSPAPVDPAPAPVDPAPADPTPSPLEQQLAEMEQKYRSLQGNFSTLNANLQTANENNARMMRIIEQREQAYAAPAAPAAPATSAGISDEERTEFGPEFVAFIERIVASGVTAGLGNFASRLDQIEQKIGQVGQQATYAANTIAKSEEEKFYDALAAAVPNFEAVNREQKFLTWLSAVDSFSGEVRKVLLDRAAAGLNAPRVIAFFEAYLRETGRGTPAAGAAEGKPTVDLATLVTPTPVAGAPDPSESPTGQRIWTQAEVDKVYADRMRGRLSEADFTRADAEIVRALAEGRIR